MKITIQSQQEALDLAVALLEHTKIGLTASGYLVQKKTNEDPYYTELRELIKALEKFAKSRQ